MWAAKERVGAGSECVDVGAEWVGTYGICYEVRGSGVESCSVTPDLQDPGQVCNLSEPQGPPS